MSKKEIIIIIISGVLTFLFSFFLFYSPSSTSQANTKKDVNSVLKVGDYTLNYGKYVGAELEYEDGKTKKTDVSIIITKDKITSNGNSNSYTVKGDKIYVDGFAMYEVTNNNTLILLAGSGVEFKYEK